MKMLRKLIGCKSLENSQESIHDGVYFSKTVSLQSKGSNSTLNKLHHKLFPE